MGKDVPRLRPAKRKRISRACDSCRARRHRCDARQPTCSACSIIHHPCSYDSSTKKRGLPTGYVRSLELLWALVFTVVPNSMSIVNELLPEVQLALDSHAKLVMVSTLVNDPEILRQVWEDSGVQTELDHLLAHVHDEAYTDVASTSIEKKEPSTVSLSLFTERSFEAIQSQLVNGGRPDSDSTTWPADTIKAETPAPRRLSTVNALSTEDVGSPTFLQTARRLIDLYFACTNCWLPLVQKHKMYEILYSPPRTTSAEAGSQATFWAILAYSSLQESREPFGPTSALDGRGAFSTPGQLYAKARQQIPNEDAQELDYVQALLILNFFKIDQGEFTAS